MTPVVSVIMPVRDGGPFLAQAVSSILGQTFSDFELLIVDDHSEDGAVRALPGDDSRLKVIKSRGRGVSAAFNTGMEQAGGRFLARMDADDIALPMRFEQQLAYLESHAEVAICGACVEIFADHPIAGGNRRYQTWLNDCRTPEAIRRELYIESPIPNPTALFRRRALEKLGGYADPAWPEDYDLFLRADAAGMKMGKPDGVLLRWREHDQRLTRTDHRYSLGQFQAAKLHYLAASRLTADVPLLIWGAGPTGALTHDLLQGEDVEIAGFLEIHPRRIGGRKRNLPVYALEHLHEDDQSFVLAAVGSAGAREKIRAFMSSAGRIEGEHYLFVA